MNKTSFHNNLLKLAIIGSSLFPSEAVSNNNIDDHRKDKNKYTKNITVQNDTVKMVGDAKAWYNAMDNKISLAKGDLSFSDIFKNHKDKYISDEILLIHEAQHQITHSKKFPDKLNGIYSQYLGYNHDEIIASIAEKLYLRTEYKSLKTAEEKSQFFETHKDLQQNKAYLVSLKMGRFKDSHKSSDAFLEEMAYIKNSSTNFWTSIASEGYDESHTELALSHLKKNSSNEDKFEASTNSEVKKVIDHMYSNIGGLDFSKIGDDNTFLPVKNQSLLSADKMLKDGADINKVVNFVELGGNCYQQLQDMDFSGLNQEEVLTIIQTSMVVEELKNNIKLDLEEDRADISYDFDFVTKYLKEQVAVFGDVKLDLLNKSNQLTQEGNPTKFTHLMDMIKKFEVNNSTIDFDKTVSNSAELKLPLEGTSISEVLEEISTKKEQDKLYWEDYYKDKKTPKPRVSDPYIVPILNLESNILKDEVAILFNKEKILPLHDFSKKENISNSIETNLSKINSNEYKNVQILKTQLPNGQVVKGTIIDGKKHGLEVVENKQGEIVNYKLYNLGKEIDLKSNSFEMKTTKTNGNEHSYLLLNNKKFGSEVVIDSSGQTKMSFYKEGGFIIPNSKESKISKKSNTNNIRKNTYEK